MLITANQAFGEWGRVFPDKAMTLAAIDRLVHHATIFEMNVESWREQCDWRRSKFNPTVRRFHQLPYRAREWSRSRKLVARVEATALGTDVRFIVTSLEGRGKTLYEKVFCPVATPRT